MFCMIFTQIVSMVDADLFDKMDIIAKRVRHSDRPFGGIQMIVTGDFFQLPPVNKDRPSKFAFEAESWRKTITQTVLLTQVFRQKDGSKFYCNFEYFLEFSLNIK